MVRVAKSVVGWVGLGVVLAAIAATGSIVGCSAGSDAGVQADPQSDAGAVVAPPHAKSVPTSDAASGIVMPPPHGHDAGAHHPGDASAHPPPPPANDGGLQQTDGGAKPPNDAGPVMRDASSGGSDDASSTPPDPTSGDAGSSDPTPSSPGTSCNAECTTASDCFAIPCGCNDGTTEYWQACGASGSCLGYGVCLNDQVCQTHGGLYDPTTPPTTCDPSDPSGCASVTCECNDGTVLDYQGCSGTSCATVGSCGADHDSVCNAHGGWVGDPSTPPPQPCPDVVCTCPDGVVYVVPDERCLGSDACATDLVCNGDS